MRRILPLGVLLFALCAFPASAILDTNSNGLSDLWERTYNGGDLFASMDPLTDDDSDGWTNAQEAAAGTNPFDANPPDGLIRPDIEYIPGFWADVNNDNELELVPASIRITWPTIQGKLYTLLCSPDLTEWISVADWTFIGDGSPAEYIITLAQDDKLFWRVKIEDVDSDRDGLTNSEEVALATNPNNADTDSDGLNDAEEVALGSNPNNNQSDSDGICDGEDAVPTDPEINWKRTPECQYVWLEVKDLPSEWWNTGVSYPGNPGDVAAVNQNGRVAFQKKLWDTGTQTWINLPETNPLNVTVNGNQEIMPSTTGTLRGINDNGEILMISDPWAVPPVYWAGIVAKPIVYAPNTTGPPLYENAEYFIRTVTNIQHPEDGIWPDGPGGIANDGTIQCLTTDGLGTYSSNSTSHAVTNLGITGNAEERFSPGPVLDATRGLYSTTTGSTNNVFSLEKWFKSGNPA